jgi:hypothetical protein
MKLTIFQDNLPQGFAQKVAELCNVSAVLVYKVSTGERKNVAVYEALINMALQYQKDKRKIEGKKSKIRL